MNTEQFTDEQGGNSMPEARNAIREIKELKKANPKATYARIIEEVQAAEGEESVSLSTLRRIMAEGSESSAGSFNYEHILVPVRDALKRLQMSDLSGVAGADVVDALKSMIHIQDEEIASLHAYKEHLEARIEFLLSQIEKKDRRMDEKDEIIKKLMDKVLG